MKYILFLLYVIVGFIPYFGTIDKIGSQWLYLSFVNFFVLIYLSNRFNYIQLFTQFFNNIPVKFHLSFIFFSLFSIFFSRNISLSLVDFSRLITTTLVVFNLYVLFSKYLISFFSISLIISIFLFFEIIYSLNPIFEFLKTSSIYQIDTQSIPNALRGITGNKNVLAADIVFKLPFVLFLTHRGPFLSRVFGHVLFLLSIFIIFLLSSRASYISLSFTLIFYIFYIIYKLFKDKQFVNASINILSLIIIGLFINYLPSTNLSVTNRVSSISTIDTSTNQRLTLWENAIDYISNSPFIGCGIGNWKVESLPYWKDLLSGYTIPYHAHNDFLELTAEIGIFGGLSYIFVFLFLFISIVKRFKSNILVSIILLSSLATYFVDAFFNFPFERAISQINFALLLALTISQTKFLNEKN